MTAFIDSGKRTLRCEQQAIANLCDSIDQHFASACQLMLESTGRVIVTGLGKSGHIGKKIAATLASTGTPAFFVHASEASHGDLGMVTANDIILALSYSGSTPELLNLIPTFKRKGLTLIAITGNNQSPLACHSDIHLSVKVEREACPLDLAPTSSTTATLAMGDALAVALLEARGFTQEDFAEAHPGGSLGRKLLTRVADVMHNDKELPRVTAKAKLTDAIKEISLKGFGMTTVMDETDHLLGIFTDGDLRRCIEKGIDLDKATMTEVMSGQPKRVDKDSLAVEALNLMQSNQITSLVVFDKNDQRPCGLLHMHDLLRAGII